MNCRQNFYLVLFSRFECNNQYQFNKYNSILKCIITNIISPNICISLRISSNFKICILASWPWSLEDWCFHFWLGHGRNLLFPTFLFNLTDFAQSDSPASRHDDNSANVETKTVVPSVDRPPSGIPHHILPNTNIILDPAGKADMTGVSWNLMSISSQNLD